MQQSKEDLLGKIKEWVGIEGEMKVLQRELRQRRARKRELSDQLVQVMKDNDIDCFDIKNGKILYTQNRVRTALSKRHLMGCLNAYFEAHPNINGTEVAQYVLEKREVKVKESIRHKLPKEAAGQADDQAT